MGIDGSGKSTLATNLYHFLLKCNIKCKYLWWLKAENSILRQSIRFLSNTIRGSKKELNAYNPLDHNSIKHNSSFMTLYQYVVLLDYIRQLMVTVWLPLKLGKIVICDRYIYDTIIAFSLEFNYSQEKYQRLFKFFSFLSPKPDLFFFVDVPENVAFSRKDDIPSPEYLSKPRSIYFQLSEIMNAKKIDGTMNLDILNEIVSNETMKIVGELS